MLTPLSYDSARANAVAGIPAFPRPRAFYRLGPNDGIRRGDREETGDNEARPTEKGSGDAHATVDDTAFGGESSISHPTSTHFDLEEERDDLDGIEIMEADDGRLGLTNTGKVP